MIATQVQSITDPFHYNVAETEEGSREKGGEEADGWQSCQPSTQALASHHKMSLFLSALNARCVVTLNKDTAFELTCLWKYG